jgi:serine/threonine protein kinase
VTKTAFALCDKSDLRLCDLIARVRLSNKDPEAIRGFIDEISLLKQLRNTPNIIQLINAQVPV